MKLFEEKMDKFLPLLPKSEIKKLFDEYNNGDTNAKRKIFVHNIRMVQYVINDCFTNIPHEEEELFEVGLEALNLAIDNYDYTKNTAFTTYAVYCIKNKILTYMRNIKRPCEQWGIDDIKKEKTSNYPFDIHSLADNHDKLLEIELKEDLNSALKSLTEYQKEVLFLYYGFYEKMYTETEIAEMYGISRQAVCDILARTLTKLKKIMLGEYVKPYRKNQK